MATPIKIQVPRSCVICGTNFTPLRCIAKCCSKKCRIAFANKNRKEAKRIWRQNNSEQQVQYTRLRRAHMLQARPKWADKEQLKAIYKEAKKRGLTVDHIIPLNHPLVSGLHVPANLQLLTRAENARKSNKFDILVGFTE